MAMPPISILSQLEEIIKAPILFQVFIFALQIGIELLDIEHVR